LLQNGQYWASSDTLWQWNGVRDPHGVYWNFQSMYNYLSPTAPQLWSSGYRRVLMLTSGEQSRVTVVPCNIQTQHRTLGEPSMWDIQFRATYFNAMKSLTTRSIVWSTRHRTGARAVSIIRTPRGVTSDPIAPHGVVETQPSFTDRPFVNRSKFLSRCLSRTSRF
jgi:hypothetical protein